MLEKLASCLEAREERVECRRDMLRHCRNMGNDQKPRPRLSDPAQKQAQSPLPARARKARLLEFAGDRAVRYFPR